MITDRNLSFLVFAIVILAFIWVFSLTRSESGLSRQKIFWSRCLAFCCVSLACITLILSFVPKAPVNLQLSESKNCQIACWNDLVIAQTTLDSLRTLLKKKFDHFEEIDTYKSTWEIGTKSFQLRTNDGMEIYINTEGDFINRINLFADRFSLSLNNIISNLGSAKYVIISYYITHNDKVTIWSEITFYFPDRGYAVTANLPSTILEHEVETCISGNELVNNITIVEPGSIDQVLIRLSNPVNPNDIYSIDQSRKYVLDSLKPLSTFGCFKMPYPPSSDLPMQSW